MYRKHRIHENKAQIPNPEEVPVPICQQGVH